MIEKPEDKIAERDSKQYLMMGLVAAFGAVGGLIAWILQSSTGGRLLPWAWYGAVPAAMVLGAGAAGIGVYVLATTDTEQRGRALFFALLCGVFFKPVWQAGSSFITGAVSQAKAQSQLSTVQSDSTQLSNSVQTAPTQQIQNDVARTGDSTAALVQQTARIPDDSVRKALQNDSMQAVDTIAAAAPKAPAISVETLSKIGIVAKQTDQENLTLHVLNSLSKIESSTTDPAIASKARQAAAEINSRNIVPKM
jgi:hypothetical protein